MAAPRTEAVAELCAADARRARTHRKRLVGRPGRAARLLRRAHERRRGSVGISRSARLELVSARVLGMTRYAELHCVSNFTFLRGASHPSELIYQACDLGYSALALTDECSMAGVVRAHEAAKER